MGIAYIVVEMPLESKVSVNSCYNRGSPRYGKLPEVEKWLWLLKGKTREALGEQFGPPKGKVRLDITIKRAKKPGRKPDPSNFRKLPQDVIASVLEVDDSVFYGTDNPIVVADSDTIVFEVHWEHDPNQPWGFSRDSVYKHPTRQDSKLYHGPLYPNLRKMLGLGDTKLCIGFGSAYCMVCEDRPTECPVEFSPHVYAKDNCPCSTCGLECPCKADDDRYTERRGQILDWWESRKKGTEFERVHWRKEWRD